MSQQSDAQGWGGVSWSLLLSACTFVLGWVISLGKMWMGDRDRLLVLEKAVLAAAEKSQGLENSQERMSAELKEQDKVMGHHGRDLAQIKESVKWLVEYHHAEQGGRRTSTPPPPNQ